MPPTARPSRFTATATVSDERPPYRIREKMSLPLGSVPSTCPGENAGWYESSTFPPTGSGIGTWQVLLRHALRNSAFGLITVVGLNLGTLIGATVIIERIFALPGLGQLLLQAINARDFVVVQACVVVFAVVAVLANLLADLLYAVLDPRIRYGSR